MSPRLLIRGKQTLKWQEEAVAPCQNSPISGQGERGRMCRDKKDRDRKRNESESPTAVRVWTFPTDTVGSAMAGTRRGVSWYGYCWTSWPAKNVTVGNNESHGSACAFRTREQWWKNDQFHCYLCEICLFDTHESWNLFLHVFPQGREDSVIPNCNH